MAVIGMLLVLTLLVGAVVGIMLHDPRPLRERERDLHPLSPTYYGNKKKSPRTDPIGKPRRPHPLGVLNMPKTFTPDPQLKRPREREQWWIDNWNAAWLEQVGHSWEDDVRYMKEKSRLDNVVAKQETRALPRDTTTGESVLLQIPSVLHDNVLSERSHQPIGE